MPSVPPNDLYYAPELGALAILDASLEVATQALLAVHPELADYARPDWDLDTNPLCHTARAFIPLAHELHSLIADYRWAIERIRQRSTGDDLPF